MSDFDDLFDEVEESQPQEEQSRAEWYVLNLRAELEGDIGYAGRDDVLKELAEIFKSDLSGWMRIEPILKEYKVLRNVAAEVKRRSRGLRVAGGDQAASRILDLIPGAPVPEAALLPDGWEVRPHTALGQACLIRRIVKQREGDLHVQRIGVAYDHLLVTAILSDVDTNETHLEVAFSAGKRWVRRTVRREVLASSRATAEALAGYGFPIHANNAKDVVQWLVDFEAANTSVLPRKFVTRQMGWQGDERAGGFVVGSDHIRPDGALEVSYAGIDAGDEHLLRCLRPKGDLDGWLASVAPMAEHPSIELALYASFAVPLLELLSAPNFCVEWSYKTSSGKTTALIAAASVWGCPDPNDRDSLISSWDMTAVGFERRAAALNGLPLLVDDTKRARMTRGESVVPGIIYEVANGQGRTRGSTTGTQATRYWRTIMLTTGEQRAVDFDKSGGSAARVVSLWGSPFGGASSRTAAAIQDLREGVFRHHGVAGRAWLTWLVDNRDRWEEWRELYSQTRRALAADLSKMDDRPSDASVLDRLAGNLAAVEVAGLLVHEALPLPWEYQSPVRELLVSAASGARTVDREAEALHLLAGHLSANLHAIEGSTEGKGDAPHGGWLGWIDSSSVSKPWERLALYVPACKSLLSSFGFEPGSILRRWKEDGILEADAGRVDRKVRIGGERRVRMVVFLREPLVSAGFGADGSVDQGQLPETAEIPF